MLTLPVPEGIGKEAMASEEPELAVRDPEGFKTLMDAQPKVITWAVRARQIHTRHLAPRIA